MMAKNPIFGHSGNDAIKLPRRQRLHKVLRQITERLAGELARPSSAVPDWSAVEWQLARAVAVIHCVSPLLSGSLRWQGPDAWQEFLSAQRRHVAARHLRIQSLLDQLDSGGRQAGIAMVALKGVALHAMGFYRPGERPMADIDLLVAPADTHRAARLLEGLGFSASFSTWKHGVFVPENRSLHAGLGEHSDNHLKIELHSRIAEKLPWRITDVTPAIYPVAPQPGINPYPSKGALMVHLLIHAAGSMAARALRLVHLHDIALVCGRMTASDWNELLAPAPNNPRWWALPPLQLVSRYFRDVIPEEVLASLAKDCPWGLRQLERRRRISEVSLSYPWVEAFPGIAWSRSVAEILEYMRARLWPDQELLELRAKLLETEIASSRTQWSRLSQSRRMLRFLTSRPLRVETLHAVRLALSHAA